VVRTAVGERFAESQALQRADASSRIRAQSKSIPDLVDGLHRGAMYFGDPVVYKGELRLTTDDGHQMGQIVVTQKPEHDIRIAISKLPAGARVRTVTNGIYGESFTASGPAFEKTVKVASATRTFFRGCK
jgi:hypothetical protein